MVKKSNKEDLIENVRQRLMGYWAMEQNQHFPKVKPPRYEAYRQYIKCRPARLSCHLAALKLDSTFLACHANAMVSATYRENDSAYNASKDYIERHWDECTAYEKKYYDYAKAFWEGKYEQAFETLDLIFREDSLNLVIQNEIAALSANAINRPDIAIKVCAKIFENYETFRPTIWTSQFLNYAFALNQLGKHDELIAFVEQLPDDDWWKKTNRRIRSELFLAYLKTGQKERAIEYIDEGLSHRDRVTTLAEAAYYWSTFSHDSIPNPFHHQIRVRIDEFPYIKEDNIQTMGGVLGNNSYFVREYIPYLLGDWEEAEIQFTNLKNRSHSILKNNMTLPFTTDSVSFHIWLDAILGNIYARQGKSDMALKQIEKVAGYQAIFSKRRSPWFRGIVPYRMAKIHALLGNKAEVVKLIKQSIQKGQFLIWRNYTFDIDLVSLRGYEPYEELVRVKE